MIDTVVPPSATCLFAAHAPQGNLPPATRFYLENIVRCGFVTHVILSGANNIEEDTVLFLDRNKITAWIRPNGGLDFGAWQFLLHRGVIAHAPYVLLANDSVYGPFHPLDRFMHRAAALRYPAWGMVASRAGGPHLQSWFVGLSRAVMQSAPVQRVFSHPFADMTREEIIRHGELGLSAAIREAGFPLHAAWSDLDTPRPLVPPTNPMHARWRSLMASGQVPFIKRELLNHNPFALPGVRDWAASLPPGAIFDPRWVMAQPRATRPCAMRDNSANRPQPNATARTLYRLVNAADTLAHKLRGAGPAA
ncbi:rhamnan synthesis F family protein [Acetobacter garciniae]|nr:rhamnan synthesis F family protein [Acetobacter garciniae]